MLAESDYYKEVIHFQILQSIVTRITSMIRNCITPPKNTIHYDIYLYSSAIQERDIELLF